MTIRHHALAASTIVLLLLGMYMTSWVVAAGGEI